MRFHIVFVAAFVVASLEMGDCSYQQINKYLVQQVNTDDVVANIEAAAKWLKSEEGKKLSVLSRAPISDLKQFVALKRLIDEPKCDQTDYEILNANEKAVKLYDFVLSDMVIRRVDKVLLKIFEDHAKKCHPVYVSNFHEKDQRLTGPMEERVYTMSKIMIPARVYARSRYLFEDFVVYRFTIKDLIGNEVMKDSIEANAKDDPDLKYLGFFPDEISGKNVINRNKVKDLVNKYLVEPCKSFVNEMGPNLFDSARLDAKFYRPTEDMPEQEESNRDYYIAWATYRLCREVAENEAAVLADVIRSIRTNGQTINYF